MKPMGNKFFQETVQLPYAVAMQLMTANPRPKLSAKEAAKKVKARNQQKAARKRNR